MSRLYFFSLLLLLSLSTQAQVTLTAADVGAVGTKYFMNIDTNGGAGLSVLNSGANQSWDFTSLTAGLSDTIEFLDPASTQYGADFPGANLCIYQEDLNGYAYLISSSSSLEIIGFAGDPAGLGSTFILPQEDPMRVANFPFSYGDSFQDTSIVGGTFGFTAFPPADSGRLKSHANRFLMADGWGEVALPGAVYNALRVKEVTTTSDSIWVHIPFLGWNLFQDTTYTDSTFTWWANGLGYLLTEVAYNGPDVSRITYQNPNQVAVQVEQHFEHAVYPNPTENSLYILQNDPKVIEMQVYSMQGQLLLSKRQGGRAQELELGSLQNGHYILRLLDKDGKFLSSEAIVVRR